MGDVSLFPNDGRPLSIQGEQQKAVSDTLWATDDTVSEWVDTADEGDVICRERQRHGYARVKRGEKLRFVGKTKSGYYVRRVLCPDCRKVELVELFLLTPKKGTKNIIERAERIGSYPNYLDRTYLNKPGTGRMKSGKIRDAIVTKSMSGVDMRDLEKEIAELEASQIEVSAS